MYINRVWLYLIPSPEQIEGQKYDGVGGGKVLAEAFGLDMAKWYRPTAEGYFGRISKAMILADLAEARAKPYAPSWEKMKKADLAALAEREVAATGWLPEPLR